MRCYLSDDVINVRVPNKVYNIHSLHCQNCTTTYNNYSYMYMHASDSGMTFPDEYHSYEVHYYMPLFP